MPRFAYRYVPTHAGIQLTMRIVIKMHFQSCEWVAFSKCAPFGLSDNFGQGVSVCIHSLTVLTTTNLTFFPLNPRIRQRGRSAGLPHRGHCPRAGRSRRQRGRIGRRRGRRRLLAREVRGRRRGRAPAVRRPASPAPSAAADPEAAGRFRRRDGRAGGALRLLRAAVERQHSVDRAEQHSVQLR
jgi:hypothetical protein